MGIVTKLAWVQLKLFLREPMTVVFTLALPLVMLLILAGVFGNATENPDGGPVVYAGVGPTNYYVPAYVVLVIASTCLISLPTQLAGSRERGVLKRFHASGVPAWAVAGAESLVCLVLAAVGATLVVAVAAVLYDFRLPRSLPGVALTFVFVAAVFSGLGLVLGAVLPTARAAQAAGVSLWFVMLLLGGSGPPREALNGAMRAVQDALPMWYAVRALHGPWLGIDPGRSWLVLGALVLVLPLLALRLFRWE
jgi:ABC-2 type transport system permease protein